MMAVVIGVLLITITRTVLPELLPKLLGNELMIPRGYQTMQPRFWQEGRIEH